MNGTGPGGSWRAVRTCARRERRVVFAFEERGMRSVCPLRRVETPRRVRQTPLFPQVVFVQLPQRADAELVVLGVPGVVDLLPDALFEETGLARLCGACTDDRVEAVDPSWDAAAPSPGVCETTRRGRPVLQVAGVGRVWLRRPAPAGATRTTDG